MSQPKRPFIFVKIAIIVYLIVPFSCSIEDEPECSGGSDWTVETKVETISILVGSVTEERGFSGEQFAPYESSVISIHVSQLEYLTTLGIRPFTNSPSLMSSAVAETGPMSIPTQTIALIQIHSDKQITTDQSDYEEGEDISDLFSIISSNIDADNMSFTEFIEEQKDGINVFGGGEYPIYLSLNEDVKIKDQEITVSITFDDESTVIATTTDLIIE